MVKLGISVSWDRFLDRLFEGDASDLYNDLTTYSYPGANYSETDWDVEEVFLSNGMENLSTDEKIIFTEIAEQCILTKMHCGSRSSFGWPLTWSSFIRHWPDWLKGR